MKNQQEQPKDDENVENIEQFQIHRAGGNAGEGHLPATDEQDDSQYTEEEIPFADGEGTQLDEWTEDEDDNDN